MSLLKDVFTVLNIKGRRQFINILAGASILAFLEVIAMSCIVPFVGLVTHPSDIQDSVWRANLTMVFGAESFISRHILVCTGLLLIFLFVLKNGLGLFLYRYQCRFAVEQRTTFCSRLLNSYLSLPYELSLNTSSNHRLRIINHESPQVFEGLILPLTLLISEGLAVFAILILLFFVDPTATIISGLVLGLAAFILQKKFSAYHLVLGESFQKTGFEMFKRLTQSLEGLKEITIFSKESFFESAYESALKRHLDDYRKIRVLGEIPRFAIEIFAVGGMLLVACLIFLQGRADFLLPLLGLFAFAAFRILPSINRMLGTSSTVFFHRPSLNMVISEIHRLNQDSEKSKNFIKTWETKTEKLLEFKNVNYSYPSSDGRRSVIKNLSFSLSRGQSLAILGSSGVGKSTIVDLLLGLLKPETGEILVDEKDLDLWRRKIGYVPQSIYLLDTSIRENIAFGERENEIDEARIWMSLELAHLSSFVKTLPHGLEGQIGERGIRLSGGQRQRLGIARALYRNPSLLIFDEATANLDEQTEKEIFEDIFKLMEDRSMIVVSHKPALIERMQNKLVIAD
jgi:ABC-type multidrug transport system fused ATPase/permease subunit